MAGDRHPNDYPKPTQKFEDFSGTKSGTKMGTNGSLGGTEGTGLNPKADKIPSGERKGRRLGGNTEGPGVTSLSAGVKHLKKHHAPTDIHKIDRG